ncbi:uncharacterized protein LOC62_02G002962 [Vanrija pseudolonga]|uniref:Uncharacterized protein n=1 Tax=Vanrija pseudolonga TaxID=143232 RepID=A0AAF0Y825_9TREE|nr:hypothetical protein LOC62_02G002962 [Vanrija pseudolonga]
MPLETLLPRLTGPNIPDWDRALTSYLLWHGAHRVLSGDEAEPYRRSADPHAPSDEHVVFPPAQVAGSAPPRVGARTTPDWTDSMQVEWEVWRAKEFKVRAVLQMTVGMEDYREIKTMWSAHQLRAEQYMYLRNKYARYFF